jgi:hypothetical protein
VINEYWGPETGDAAQAVDHDDDVNDDDVNDDALNARQITSGKNTG